MPPNSRVLRPHGRRSAFGQRPSRLTRRKRRRRRERGLRSGSVRLHGDRGQRHGRGVGRKGSQSVAGELTLLVARAASVRRHERRESEQGEGESRGEHG